MKSKKILAVLLAVAALISMTGFTANAAAKATGVTFSRTNDIALKVGYAITRAAVTTPEGLAVAYTSSDATIAVVNENGQVVGKKPGKAVITATADGLSASYNVVVSEAVSTKVFDGFTVTVLDKANPAVTIMGRATDRNVMCFLSADGKEVGAISYSDHNAIIQKNQKVVNLPGGGTYGAPPVDGKSWEVWFADEFNKYRGLDAGSGSVAQAEYAAELVELYRQELIRLTNAEREKAGLPVLEIDSDVMAYAQVRAKEISTFFSHDRPNGKAKEVNGVRPIEIITAAGMTPEEAVEAWMASTGHRNNILNSDALAFGVGAYQTANGTWFWTQEFLW